jgi:hypothetical protein
MELPRHDGANRPAPGILSSTAAHACQCSLPSWAYDTLLRTSREVSAMPVSFHAAFD